MVEQLRRQIRPHRNAGRKGIIAPGAPDQGIETFVRETGANIFRCAQHRPAGRHARREPRSGPPAVSCDGSGNRNWLTSIEIVCEVDLAIRKHPGRLCGRNPHRRLRLQGSDERRGRNISGRRCPSSPFSYTSTAGHRNWLHKLMGTSDRDFFAISDAHILFAAASHGNRERRRAAKQYERWGQCDDKGQGTRAGIE